MFRFWFRGGCDQSSLVLCGGLEKFNDAVASSRLKGFDRSLVCSLDRRSVRLLFWKCDRLDTFGRQIIDRFQTIVMEN